MTTEPITGWDLVAKIHEAVVTEPGRFHMPDWAALRNKTAYAADPTCGTALCVAGWACNINGITPAFSEGYGGELMRSTLNGRLPDGALVNIPEKAMNLLGEAFHEDLFGGTNYEAALWLEDMTREHRPVEYARIHGITPAEPSALTQVIVPEVMA